MEEFNMTKTWFITGTSTGFGKELARLLAQKDDVNLVATARKPEQLSYLDEFDHGHILKLKLDITNQEEIQKAVKATLDTFGSIDVLVNNAGIGYFGTFEESNRETVQYMFDVNVWGLVDMTRAVLPTMRKQNEGVIINFSSIGGLYSFPTLSFYHGTKYAVEGLSESLAKEVAHKNIQVSLSNRQVSALTGQDVLLTKHYLLSRTTNNLLTLSPQMKMVLDTKQATQSKPLKSSTTK